jgi:hypothetical protein
MVIAVKSRMRQPEGSAGSGRIFLWVLFFALKTVFPVNRTSFPVNRNNGAYCFSAHAVLLASPLLRLVTRFLSKPQYRKGKTAGVKGYALHKRPILIHALQKYRALFLSGIFTGPSLS